MTFDPARILVALITPFTDDGALATADLERLAHGVLDDGAAGIVVLGTTAEASALTPQERRQVVRICSRVCRARGASLVVGAGSNDTAGALRAIEEWAAHDVDAALTVVPYYVRPGQAGVVAHFEHLAERSPLPLILYNVPYRTSQGLGSESVLRLAQHPRIVGIKQAVGAVDVDTARILAARPDGFSVLAGEDTLASPLLAIGADGAVLATANVCAREYTALYELWNQGDVARARRWGSRLVGPAAALMSTPNPTMIKAVLHAQGRISAPTVRLPLLHATVPAGLIDDLRALRRDTPVLSSSATSG